jgi:invasion protein IalB
MSLRTLACIAAFACPSLSAPVSAQEDVANGQKFGAWTVSCEALGKNRTTCILTQTLNRDNDNAFIAQMMAFWSSDGSQRFIAARVPMDAYLPSGFAIRAEDSDEAIPFVWQSCFGDVCEAMRQVDGEEIDTVALETGTVLGSFRPRLGMEPFVFRFSMEGLDAGLEALRPAAAE